MIQNPGDFLRALDRGDHFAARIEMAFGDAPRTDEDVQAGQLRTGEFDGFSALAGRTSAPRRVRFVLPSRGESGDEEDEKVTCDPTACHGCVSRGAHCRHGSGTLVSCTSLDEVHYRAARR